MCGDRPILLIIHSETPRTAAKRAMRVISKSCYGAHTDPIFKNLCILPLNVCVLSLLRIIVSQNVYRSVKLPLRLS